MEMRRDLNELASMLFPDPADVVREGLGGILPPTYEGGVALADSEGGAVRVLPDGTVTTWADGDPDGTAEDAADPDAEAAEPVTVPCTANVREGDRVLLVVQDGAYVDCMAAGSGDRVAATASQAEAIATATQQHFWADGNGIHVSTDEGDAAGANNILINSLGILLRELQTVLLELSSSGVIVGDQSGTHLSVDPDSVDIIDGNGDVLFTMGVDGGNANLLTTLDSAHFGRYVSASERNYFELSRTPTTSATNMRAQMSGGNLAHVSAQVDDSAGRSGAHMTAQYGTNSKLAKVELSATNSASAINLSADDVTVNNAAPIVYEDKTVTVGSTAALSNFMTSVSVAKTGYTTVGVVDWWWDTGTRQNFFNSWGVFTSGNTLYVRLCNLHGSQTANGTFKARVLYVKDELL